jgi:protease I
MRIAILVTDYFEQVELTEPRSALANAGAKTNIISSRRGEVQGVNHIDKADTFPVDLTFDLASADDFDAVHIPGGVFNADQLRMIPEAQGFVRRMQKARKPISVICHGPWLLVSAGLVKGRTLHQLAHAPGRHRQRRRATLEILYPRTRRQNHGVWAWG